LNAPKGDNGADGVNGSNGVNGVDGSNGTNGQNGVDGANALVKTSTEPSGSNCQNGGTKIETGLDINKNGILDSIEVQSNQTQYICNGSNATSNVFTHWIGEYYGGGVIFQLWKDTSGIEHGLIVDITDIGMQFWVNAVVLCSNSTNGGQNDWYLPSRTEIEMIYLSRYTINKTLNSLSGATLLSPNDNNSQRYWCNYIEGNNAYYYQFSEIKTENGSWIGSYTSLPCLVRAIRSF
jgi:hypothetical protein